MEAVDKISFVFFPTTYRAVAERRTQSRENIRWLLATIQSASITRLQERWAENVLSVRTERISFIFCSSCRRNPSTTLISSQKPSLAQLSLGRRADQPAVQKKLMDWFLQDKSLQIISIASVLSNLRSLAITNQFDIDG